MKKDIKSTKRYINFLKRISICAINCTYNITWKCYCKKIATYRQVPTSRAAKSLLYKWQRLFDAISRSSSIFPQEIRKTRRAHFRRYSWRYTTSPPLSLYNIIKRFGRIFIISREMTEIFAISWNLSRNWKLRIS